MSTLDSRHLERWAAYRDAEAFRLIVHRYGSMVFGVCSRVLHNPTDAEEVTQECFEILATAKTPPEGYSLGAWLHGMATKRSLMRLRSDRRRTNRETEYASKQPRSVEIGWNDVYQYVDAAVAALPDELRIPLAYHFYEGLSDRRIAHALGLSRRTVRDRIARGVDAIAESLRERGLTLGAMALSTLMYAKLAEAVPLTPSLSASLGQLALARAACRPSTGRIVLSRMATFWSGTAGKRLAALIGISTLLVLTGHGDRPVEHHPEASRRPRIDAAHGVLLESMEELTGLADTPSEVTAILPPILEANGEFGWAVTVLDDLTGDGIPDIGLGARCQRGALPDGAPGRVHLLDGASGASIATLDSPHPEPACVPWACDAKGEFGAALTTLQDLNGNGYRELVVGAPGERVGEYFAAGHVYIFDSLTRDLIRTLQTPNLERFANFGDSVAMVPDTNRDGFEDLVVGAVQESPAQVDAAGRVYHLTAAGRAYVFSGATGQVLQTLDSPDGWDVRLFGREVAGMSDLDGDGAGDVVVGQDSDRLDHAHVYSGATGARLASLGSPNEPDEGGFGTTLLAVPDCNGNGSGDFLVASPWETVDGRPRSGRVYLFDGTSRTVVRTFEAPSAGHEDFGCALAYSDDIAKGGQPGYLIAMRNRIDPVTYASAIAVYNAADGACEGTLRSPAPGIPKGSHIIRIASVKDLNGDGRSDLLITAPLGVSRDGIACGQAYLMKSPFLSSAKMPKPVAALAADIPHGAASPVDVQPGAPAHGSSTGSVSQRSWVGRFLHYARRIFHTITGQESATNRVGDSAEGIDTGDERATPESVDQPWGCRPRHVQNES